MDCPPGSLFSLPPNAWLLSLLVSLFTSVGGLPLFQLGVRYCGASTAASLSTLEPITNVILGMLVLGETLSVLKLVGGILMIASVVLISTTKEKMRRRIYPPIPPKGKTSGFGLILSDIRTI